MEYLLTLLGFVILIISGSYLVKGSVSLARHFGLSTLVIGVTIVAFGTSAPELLVSLQSAFSGFPEMAMGNVIGSNISNIALVLALTAIILPIPVNRNSIITDWPVMMLAGLLLLVFVLDNNLGLVDGIIFILMLIAFTWYSIAKSRKTGNLNSSGENPKARYSILLSLGLIILAAAGLAFGAKILVSNTTMIARALGISERAIAISMLAVGTSLPELVTSVVAAIQKETDISVGNILGSNIFNVLSVLGITAILRPIQIEGVIFIDIIVMLVISLVLLLMMVPSRKGKITRIEGIILILAYMGYMVYVFQ